VGERNEQAALPKRRRITEQRSVDASTRFGDGYHSGTEEQVQTRVADEQRAVLDGKNGITWTRARFTSPQPTLPSKT